MTMQAAGLAAAGHAEHRSPSVARSLRRPEGDSEMTIAALQAHHPECSVPLARTPHNIYYRTLWMEAEKGLLTGCHWGVL
jgi:hypothetical protein